jgi:hypothetical protein
MRVPDKSTLPYFDSWKRWLFYWLIMCACVLLGALTLAFLAIAIKGTHGPLAGHPTATAGGLLELLPLVFVGGLIYISFRMFRRALRVVVVDTLADRFNTAAVVLDGGSVPLMEIPDIEVPPKSPPPPPSSGG